MKLSWKDCIKVSVSVFTLYLAVHYWKSVASLAAGILGAAMPLVTGGVIAYLVNILMANFERHYFPGTKHAALIKSRRLVCMILAFATLAAIIVLVFWLILPQLAECIGIIIAAVPKFMERVLQFADDLGIFSAETLRALESIDWQSQIGKLVQMVTSGLGSVVDVVISAVSSVFSIMVTALLSIIFAIYLLSGKERLGRQFGRLMHRFLPDRIRSTVFYVLGVLDNCFHRYIVGQCTEAVILGVLCTLGMWILGLPYAAMIGALVAFTALIPVAGGYIGAGVGAFMILTVAPWEAVVFLIFIVVLQQLEGNLIYPRVVGSSMGLPGIWVLAAVTIGGGLAGIVGMLLGVPLAAAAYRIVRDDVRKHEMQNRPEETGEDGE